MDHLDYMTLAAQLALKGKGTVSPNPMVGAIIVKSGKIIARGYHARCGKDHAEVVALKAAGRRARGADLYVTLEPCSHHGRTPPCVDRIIKSGIKNVLIGMKDPNPLMNGRSIGLLKNAGVGVQVGFMDKELQRMNEVFVKFITQRMPFVVAKSAQTLDGKIAARNGQSQWITSPESRRQARIIRNDFDAIMVGINTVLKDNPFLNAARQSKRLKKIILDSQLQTPLNARLFENTSLEDVIVVTTKKAARSRIQKLSRKARLMIAPQKNNRIDLKWLFRELAREEIASLLIEGGASVIGDCLKHGLVDKMHIYIAPKILGDASALGSVTGFDINHVDRCVRLKDISIERIADDIFIQGYVYRNH